jgi:uncharacterized damage-inducible protein DinB
MVDPTLFALLAWNRTESRRWKTWFVAHPSAVDVSMGTGAGTVRKAIHHTFVVDLRYGQRLTGMPVSAFETIDVSDLDGLFSLAERAHDLLETWLVNATPATLDQVHTFMTLSAGELSASARKIFVHCCTHHVRHWAQVATVLRMNGHKSDWPHDLILSDAMR